MLYTVIMTDAFTMCRLASLQEKMIQEAKVPMRMFVPMFSSYELTFHAAVIPDSPLVIPDLDKELSGR